MAKLNKSRKNHPRSRSKILKSRKILNRIPNKYKFLICFVFLLSIGTIFYVLLPKEDLGPQLPPPPANAIYKQSSQPIEMRVEDLLSRMTLEEKIGQMSLVDKNSLQKIEDVSRYNLGAVMSGAGAKPKVNNPQAWFSMIDEIKRQASGSRLQIPILYGLDANHGHSNVLGATIFLTQSV